MSLEAPRAPPSPVLRRRTHLPGGGGNVTDLSVNPLNTVHTLTWIHLNQTHLHVIRSSSPHARKADTSHHLVSGLVHTKRTANDSTAYHLLLTSLLFTSSVPSSMCSPVNLLRKLSVWDPFALQFINKHLWFTLDSVWVLLSRNTLAIELLNVNCFSALLYCTVWGIPLDTDDHLQRICHTVKTHWRNKK